MADLVVATKTIGSAGGRDFSTLVAYRGSLPNPFGNTRQEGILFADGDFDEQSVNFGAPLAADNVRLFLHGKIGELPTFKPASGSPRHILRLGNDVNVAGITCDGANISLGDEGLFRTAGARVHITGCVARNAPKFGFAGTNGEIALWLYCLADNCVDDGFGGTFIGNPTHAIGCGAALCGTGFGGTSPALFYLLSCWALSNTLDIEDSSIHVNGRNFVYISDTSIPAKDDVFRNQVPANLGFVNFPGRDYRLAAGSALIGKGEPIWSGENKIQPSGILRFAYLQLGIQDAFSQKVGLDFGTRMNIGPFQPGRADAAAAEPTTKFVSIP